MTTRLLGRTAVSGAALGVVCALGVAFTAVQIRVSWGGSYWVFGAIVGVVLTGCALARSLSPVTAAITGAAVAGVATAVAATAGLPREPGPVAAFALAVLVAAAVRRLPVRSASAVAAGGLAVTFGSFAAAGGAAVVPVMNALAWSSAVGIGLARRALDLRRHAMREAVRRDERLELARELHDVVAHHITGIVVQAQAAQLVAGRDAAAPVQNALAGIETAGTEALAAMRRVVGVLRDASDAVPLAADAEELPALLDRFAERAGPVVHRQLTSSAAPWPPEVTSTVYRIVQESLTNVTQHAPQAGAVSVSVSEEGSLLAVEVTDDAPPSAARYHRRGYGLIGMRERVESLGGTLSAGPREGSGWTVRATIPLRPARVPTGEARGRQAAGVDPNPPSAGGLTSSSSSSSATAASSGAALGAASLGAPSSAGGPADVASGRVGGAAADAAHEADEADEAIEAP